jgi:DNA-directed RNA polymerase subunit RPC12/RpoP
MRYACLACWKSCEDSELLEPREYLRLPAEQRAISAPDYVGCPHCYDTRNIYPMDDLHDELFTTARYDDNYHGAALDLIREIVETRDADIADRDRTIKSLRCEIDSLRGRIHRERIVGAQA